MTESDLAEARFQISVLTAEKDNFERSNVVLISQVTKLEKRITELHASLRTAQTENETMKNRCEQYQRAYQELSHRLGTYDTHLIEKLEDKARRAEAEVRRLRTEYSRSRSNPFERLSEDSPDTSKIGGVVKGRLEVDSNCQVLRAELDKCKKQIEILVDQLTTEIANSAKTQEAFLCLKDRYQELYRETREDAVSYPIPAPDPQDTPRLPYCRPSSLIASQGKAVNHRRVCSRCGQSLPDTPCSPAK